MTEILHLLNGRLALFLVFPLVVTYGLYLSVKLSWLQIRGLKKSIHCLFHQGGGDEGSISRFGAITAVLAGNFGTGNISGIAVALATGGPGALVWMWIMVLFGSIIQYASSLLGVLYRTKNSKGEYVGGPMYYLDKGLGMKGVATSFCLFTVLGAITVGNLAQVNSMVLPLVALDMHPTIASFFIAVLVGLVLIGGIQRLSNFASLIVPFMAILYLGAACIILAINFEQVLPTLQLMFQKAFAFDSLAGGVAGAALFKAITVGFDRAIFATDAGTGIVPILQSGARSDNPVNDGIATLITPILVMIVCTATGLVLLITGANQVGLESTNMVTHAFAKGIGHDLGGTVVMVALLLFAFTTILAWAYCGEKALGYLFGQKCIKWYRLAYIALIPIGSLMQVALIWTLADLSISLMLITNLVGIIALTPVVLRTTKERLTLS